MDFVSKGYPKNLDISFNSTMNILYMLGYIYIINHVLHAYLHMYLYTTMYNQLFEFSIALTCTATKHCQKTTIFILQIITTVKQQATAIAVAMTLINLLASYIVTIVFAHVAM